MTMPNIHIDLSHTKDVILPTFYPLLHDTNPIMLLRGGRGSGKSYLWAEKIIYRILHDLNDCRHNIVVLRKWSEHCDRSVVKQIQRVIDDWRIGSLVSYNKIEKTFRFPQGSQIICLGANDPERLKSITDITSLVLEEATEFTDNYFVTIDLSMRGTPGTYLQTMMSFNPVNINCWVYQRFYKNGPQPGVTYHHSTYLDNPHNGPGYKARLDRICGENEYLKDVLINGEWGAVSGLIFSPNQWSIGKPDRLESENAYGLDFGWSNPTALIQVNRINEDTFYLKELVYSPELHNPELIGRMQTMGIGDQYIYADGARPEHIEEIYQAGFNIYPADKRPGSVWAGLTFCKRFKYIIDPESTNLIDEFRVYSWKKNKQGDTLEEPIKENDHAADAVRYVLFSHFAEDRMECKLYT
jgi:phage terminase large subunit